MVLKRYNAANQTWEIIGPQISNDRLNYFNEMIAPEYSPSETYLVGNYVVHRDVLYRCTTTITFPEEFTLSHWVVANLGTELENIRDNFIKISNTQPNNPHNIIWIDPDDSDNDDIVIPTIDELKDVLSSKAPAILKTVSGNIANFDDGADGIPIKSLVANIEPQQNLHGYDSPWPAGGGKNKISLTLTNLKARNTSGTWDENTYTINGITFTVSANGDAVTAITVEGTNATTSWVSFYIPVTGLVNGESYVLNGTPTGGSSSKYREALLNYGYDYGSSYSFTKNKDGNDLVSIDIAKKFTAQDIVFYPMIRLASKTDATFEPYENLCPISSWTGADVGNRGKNLYNKDSVSKWCYLDENGAVVNVDANQGWTISDYIYIPHMILAYKGITIPGTAPHWCWYDKKKQFISSFSVAAGNGVLTPPENAAFLRCSVIEQASTSTYDTHTLCIVVGNTVGEYEAYKGQIFHITFPTEASPVYGGTLDVVNKKLTVIYVLTRITSSSFTHMSGDGKRALSNIAVINIKKPASNGNKANIICNQFPTKNHTGSAKGTYNSTSPGISVATNGEVGITFGTTNNLEQFKQAFSALGVVTICYELATPVEFPLSDIPEITTLLGTNNVWTDVGPVEVTYTEDTWTYLDNPTNGAMPFRSTLTELLFTNYCEAMDLVVPNQYNKRSIKIKGNVIEVSPLIDPADGSTFYSFVLNKPIRYVGDKSTNFTPNLVADDFSRIHLTNAQRLVINLSILFGKAASSGAYAGPYTSGALFAATYDPVTETATVAQIVGQMGVVEGLERSINVTTDITHLLPAIRDNGNICIIFQSRIPCIKEKWVIDLHIETDATHNPNTLLYGADYRNNTSVAEKNITAGTYIMQNGALLQATEDIAVDTELAGKVSGKTILGILNDFEARLKAIEGE